MGKVPDDLIELDGVEAEVDTLRDRTQEIVAELERRLRNRAHQAQKTYERVRHAVDVKQQIAEHPAIVAGAASAAALALGIGVYAAVSRMLAARKPMNRLRGRLQGYRALLANPKRAVRPRPSIGRRLLVAVLAAGATTLVKGLGTLLIQRAQESRRLAPPPRQLGAGSSGSGTLVRRSGPV